MKKEYPSNGVISKPHRSYVSLNGYTWSVRVHENASVVSIFAIFNGCFIIDNRRGILSYQIRQLHCSALVSRAHNLFPCTVLYMETFFSFC